MNRLNKASGDDPTLLRKLLNIYFSETPGQLDQLAAAITENSVAEVNRLAHKTSGASLSLGFTAMAVPLREIEKLADSGNLQGAAALHRRLTLNLDQTKQFFST